MRKYLFISFITIFLMTISNAFSEDLADQYSKGVEKYRNEEYPEALKIFLELIAEDPENIKADDAIWYMGRIYMKLDQTKEAERMFLRVLALPDSNRLTESAYDLGRIYYSENTYMDVINLFKDIMDAADPDSYQVRSMFLLGKAFYYKGLEFKAVYEDKDAAEAFMKSKAVFEKLLEIQEETADRAESLYNLGKAYKRLFELNLGREQNEIYYSGALKILEESGLEKADVLKEELMRDNSTDISMDLNILGGADNILVSPGFSLSAEANMSMPLGFRQSLEGSLKYSHDDFVFKTFNFDPLETDDTRLVETNDKFSFDLSLLSGSTRSFLHTLRIDADYTFAEDDGDSSYLIKLSDDGALRLDPDLKTGWKSDVSLKIFPDYLVDGHKIDSLSGSLNPYFRWYLTERTDLTLGYTFSIKQYLDARYDTENPSVSSEKNRLYIDNSAELQIKTSPADILDFSLSYIVTNRESNNYDVWVTDTVSTDIFMPDYYDYWEHTVRAGTDLNFSSKMKFSLDGEISLRKFSNYIPRDSAGVFLSSEERRQDVDLKIDSDFSFLLWENENGRAAEFISGFWWQKSISNMEYESSFDTNSIYYGALAGLSIRLP